MIKVRLGEMTEERRMGKEFLKGVAAARPFALAALMGGFGHQDLDELVYVFGAIDRDAVSQALDMIPDTKQSNEAFDVIWTALNEQAIAGLQVGIAIGLLIRPEVIGGAK
jgi:hypothetical protein